MQYHDTPFNEVKIISLEKRGDERGFFARTFCQREMATQQLVDTFVQINSSYSSTRGTLRGLHFQLPPFREVKIVRCLRGSVFDVIVDIRPDSSRFGQHYAMELTADNSLMLYVPHGFAHGFLTLEDHCELQYLVSEFYHPEAERGLQWNDPELNIPWPFSPRVVSPRDTSNPLLRSLFL